MPGAASRFLLLVAMPFVTNSFMSLHVTSCHHARPLLEAKRKRVRGTSIPPGQDRGAWSTRSELRFSLQTDALLPY